MSEEKWKEITLAPNYEVSNHGRIRNRSTRYIRKPVLDRDGYPKVVLGAKHTRYWNARIHRLVAEAFIGPLPCGYHTAHKDGDKMNCRVSNLVYLSQSESIQMAVGNGLFENAGGRGDQFVSERTIKLILSFHDLGLSIRSISQTTGLSRRLVSAVVNGKREIRPQKRRGPKYTPHQMQSVLELRKKNFSERRISKVTGMHRSTVHRILQLGE